MRDFHWDFPFLSASGGLTAWLSNQAFQFHNYIRILLELPFIFSIFPVRRLKQRLRGEIFSLVLVAFLRLFA